MLQKPGEVGVEVLYVSRGLTALTWTDSKPVHFQSLTLHDQLGKRVKRNTKNCKYGKIEIACLNLDSDYNRVWLEPTKVFHYLL